ncbi:MAG: hypothetical protein AAF585_00855 [Verrucomicrobiota bacterium]
MNAADDQWAPIIPENKVQVLYQWMNDSESLFPGGEWFIGSRPNQKVTHLCAHSWNAGDNFNGEVTYEGEKEPFGFRGERTSGNVYRVTQREGGFLGAWDPAGTWVIGDCVGNQISNLDLKFDDELQTLAGTISYSQGGQMGFRVAGNEFENPGYETSAVDAQWRTFRIQQRQQFSELPWEDVGEWVIGGLSTARLVQLEVYTDNPEGHLQGSLCYNQQATINFRGNRTAQNTYQVDHQWCDSANWYPCGTWTLGHQPDSHLLVIDLFSEDGGKSMYGSFCYMGGFPQEVQAFSVADGATEVTRTQPEPVE